LLRRFASRNDGLVVRPSEALTMDLGIAGRNAIVCASSRGLGRACAEALAAAGVRVVVNGRDPDRLARTRDEIAAATGADIVAVAADVSTAEGRAALLAALPHVDILVNNNGGPPPRDFREVDHDAMIAGLEANMIAPIALIQAVVDGMQARGFGRIVNITSGSVKAPLAGLDLSSGARAGLTGFVAGVARNVAAGGVTINNLLPGAFDTDRIAALLADQGRRADRDPAELRRLRERSIPAGRFGAPAEFGAACAFLCSAQAGYITGQSILIDGGAFPGIL
jgi:3-oxoacyl-[acyl-carrier protein] reductase